jgi:plastocyanin
MGRRLRAGAAVALVALVVPALAWADKQIQAGPGNRYTTTDVTIDQGEKVTFHNGDTVAHDVTATQNTPDGKPLFRSATTDPGKDAPVDGTQYLTTGHYDFICSIHPDMKGSIHVTTNGTPVKRAGGGSSSAPTGAKDTVKPTVVVRVASRHVHDVRAGHDLTVRVQLSEPGHVELRAIARPRPGGPLVTVARGTTRLKAAGLRRVHLRLTRAGRAAVRRHRGLAVIVTAHAMDLAGNAATATHGRTLGA